MEVGACYCCVICEKSAAQGARPLREWKVWALFTIDIDPNMNNEPWVEEKVPKMADSCAPIESGGPVEVRWWPVAAPVMRLDPPKSTCPTGYC